MPALEAQQRFERYRIMQQIGSSASGESYTAEDMVLQRKVTLKLLHPWAPLSYTARRQFFREMQDVSLLRHPYLATVLDYGEINSRLYFVRHYVKSGSLLSNEGRASFTPPLHTADAIHYTHQLAQVLEYIHQHGCYHGALTLTNILVQQNTFTNEYDVAPFLLVDVGLTDFVRNFGQPQIQLLPITAAPEQFEKRVTAASDQYALAVLLYFWLTGRPAFFGTPEEIAHLKRTETILALTSLNMNVKVEQERILRRALAVSPEERYPSILAFADALMATLNSLSGTASAFEPELQVKGSSIFETIPQTDPARFADKETVPALAAIAATEPAPDFGVYLEQQPLPQPTPEPLPQPAPEPLPVPAPEPLPQPAPEPLPEPVTEPFPQPDILPQPEPDIFQPLPQTNPGPTMLLRTEALAQSIFREQQTTVGTLHWQPALSPRLLICLHDVEGPYEVLLERDEIRLGRAGSDDVLLSDRSTSRHHALLKREDDHHVIYDQSSTNGVFVNGQKLADGRGFILVDGDHIGIGNYELIFRCVVQQAASRVYEEPQTAAIAELVKELR
ncbi:MAG: hypothetical protein NVSMB33_01270 [Ktedonobacteraceae bacterium]